LTASGALAVLLALLIGLRLRIDNSPEIWLPRGDVELERYRDFQTRFGADAIVALASRPLDLDSDVVRVAIARVAQDLGRIEGVVSVASPLAADGARRRDPLSVALVGSDGDRVALLATLDHELAAARRADVVDAIERLAEQSPFQGRLGLVGTDVITRDLDRGSQASFGGLFPLVALLLSGVVHRSLRSFPMLLGILLAGSFAALAALAAMALVGASLNLLVVLMPAILMVLTSAAAIHLCLRYLDLARASDSSDSEAREQLWARAWRETLRPCVLTTATTAVGFGSLCVSELAPVRNLGLYTAFGAVCVLCGVFTIVPAVAARAAIPRHGLPSRSGYERYIGRVIRHRAAVVILFGVLGVLAALGVARTRVESSVLEFFGEDHPVPTATRDFEEHFFGLTTYELWLEGSVEALATPAALAAVEQVRELARDGAWVTGAIAPLDVLDDVPTVVRGALWQRLLSEPPAELSRYLWRDGDRAALRVTLTGPTKSSNRAYATVVALREACAQVALPADCTLRVSGAAPLLVRGQVLLLETQIRSFAVALGLITLIVLVAFRSWRSAALSVVANALPIAGTLGIMGWVGIPLDAGTVTVAGIALGLVIDDTIHLLHGFAARHALPMQQRLASTLWSVGRPVVVTSIAVAFGFGAFAFASFRPTHYFGLLLAATATFALITDLLLVPALFSWLPDNRPAGSPQFPRNPREAS